MGTAVEEAELSLALISGGPKFWDHLETIQENSIKLTNKVPHYKIKDVRPVLDTLRALRHLTQRDVSSPVKIIKRSGDQWSLKDTGEVTLSLR